MIVGGVLVGQNLIKAAALRATISQYENFNTAVNTFRLKYEGLPGDLIYNKAVAFGFVTAPNWYTHINNGNGILMCFDSAAAIPQRSNPCGEILFFWRYLSDARLISGSYSPNLVTPTNASPSDAATTMEPINFFPKAKAGVSAYWVVGNDGAGNNHYSILSMSSVAVNGSYYHNPSLTRAFMPIDAYSIDTKIDNGMPNSGTVQARGTSTFITWDLGGAVYPSAELNATNAAPYAASPVSGTCTTGGATSIDTTNAYATNVNAAANAPACNLRLKFN